MLSSLVALLLNQSPLVYVVVILAAVWYLNTMPFRQGGLPPAPRRPLPILGHLPYIGTDPSFTFRKWRQTQGDIFSVFMGNKLMVVMNSYDLLREVFVKQADHFSDRPNNFLSEQLNILKVPLGIVAGSGPKWKENRAVAMGILKDLGMGKNWLADKISEETVLLKFTSIVHGIPWLLYLPGDLFKAKKILSNTRKLNALFSARIVIEAQENAGGQGEDNFISSYFKHMKEKEKLGEHTNLNESELVQVLTDLFGAGSETTTTTIIWTLLFAMRYPEAQEKFYQEILEVTGPERRATMSDKSKMNYVNAFIMETQRLGSIVPLSVSHDCNETVEVAGYTIPKGATILPNLDEVLKDTKTWKDPNVFRPERFLDKDGKVFVPDEFIPYGVGRRYCMGEALAKMELFLFLTGMFQRFQIRPEDPENLPSMERVFGITCIPKPFNVRLLDRHSEQ